MVRPWCIRSPSPTSSAPGNTAIFSVVSGVLIRPLNRYGGEEVAQNLQGGALAAQHCLHAGPTTRLCKRGERRRNCPVRSDQVVRSKVWQPCNRPGPRGSFSLFSPAASVALPRLRVRIEEGSGAFRVILARLSTEENLMKSIFWFSTLAGISALGVPLMAQTTTLPSLPQALVFHQSFTTGMVGFTVNQTARLNVLNLNPIPATSATQSPNCTVELQFFDDKNSLLKQSVVPNFAPGTTTSFDLTRAIVTSETAPRAEIRGVVVVNPVPTPVESPAPTGYCSVMTTLEIFDAATGSTVALTSDARVVGLGIVATGAAQPVR